MFDIIDRNGKKELFRWFQAVNKPMKVVVIPDEVEALCNYTFSNHSVGQVDLIWMPDTITEIPMYCFYKCTARAIRMSRNVKTIGEYAFANMPNLWMLKVPEGCNLGIKRYDGTWMNQNTVFYNSPKHAPKWSPWIDFGTEYDTATVLWEGDEGNVLLKSLDLKNWEVVDEGKGVYQYPLDGVKRCFKVGAKNVNPTQRTKDQTYVSRTKTIVIK